MTHITSHTKQPCSSGSKWVLPLMMLLAAAPGSQVHHVPANGGHSNLDGAARIFLGVCLFFQRKSTEELPFPFVNFTMYLAVVLPDSQYVAGALPALHQTSGSGPDSCVSSACNRSSPMSGLPSWLLIQSNCVC